MESTSEVLTGRDLMRLKEEYAAAVVEKMTQAEARAYLRDQIILQRCSCSGRTRAFPQDL